VGTCKPCGKLPLPKPILLLPFEEGVGLIKYRHPVAQFGESFTVLASNHTVTLSSCRNAVAISDGPQDKSTGRIIFYLTDFDQTAVDLKACSCLTGPLCDHQLLILFQTVFGMSTCCTACNFPLLLLGRYSSGHVDDGAHLPQANPKATLNLCEAQRPGECVSLDPEAGF